MKLDVDAFISHPRPRVFAAYRDELVKLVPFLPNVRGIDQVSRTDEGPRTKLLNHWRGGGEIPAVARAFLSEKLLEWDDYASWDEAAWTCDWRTEVPAFKEALRAEGRNHFEEVPGGTRLVIRGNLEVDARKVKGVPRLLAGTIGPAVEAFLVATVKPNLTSVAAGLEKYLNRGAP